MVTNPASIIARIRSHGANLVLEAGKLRIINASKLPVAASGVIQANRAALASHLQNEAEAVEERASIIEFEGKTPRQWAEAFAEILIRSRPSGITDLDWGWFIARCGQILDEAPERESA